MQSFGEMLHYVGHLEPWLSHLIISLVVVYTLCIVGLVLLRTGRSPLWAFVLLVPYAGVVGLWLLAYIRWPRMDGANTDPARRG